MGMGNGAVESGHDRCLFKVKDKEKTFSSLWSAVSPTISKNRHFELLVFPFYWSGRNVGVLI